MLWSRPRAPARSVGSQHFQQGSLPTRQRLDEDLGERVSEMSEMSEGSKRIRRTGVVFLYIAIDAAVWFSSFYFVYMARFEASSLFRFPPDLFQQLIFQSPAFLNHLRVLGIMGLLLAVLMYKNGLYGTTRDRSMSDELVALVGAALMTLVLGTVVSFFWQQFTISRLILVAHSGLLLLGLGGWRVVKRTWVRHLVAQGYRHTGALIVGAGRVGKYLQRSLEDRPWLGIDVLGFLDDQPQPGDDRQGIQQSSLRSNEGPTVLGCLEDLAEVAERLGDRLQELYISIPSERKKVKELVDIACVLGLTVHIIPDMFDLLMREVAFESVGSLTVLRLYKPALGGWERFVKRVEDICCATILLLAFGPLWAMVSLAVKLDSRGPVLYRQVRHGKDGAEFVLLKFRSMNAGADTSRHRELAKQLVRTNQPVDENGLYKLCDDDRVTRVGRLIRKFNLDEIPQLVNVLVGDMSVVGPRPPLPYEYEEYKEYCRKRLAIKPGITGLWQVSGLHRLSFQEMVALDVRYINEWSFWLDLSILLRTVPVLLRGKGH